MSADRYAGLDAHADTGLGAEEPGTRRFTRPSERMGAKVVRPTHTPASGADVIRAEALASLERRIAHTWEVWEGLSDGQSRTNLAAFIHGLEDRADQLKEDLSRGNTTPSKTSPAKNAVIEGDSTTHEEK